MKKLWLELDISGTRGDEAWKGIEKPKGFIDAGILETQEAPCDHAEDMPHPEGELGEIWVQVEAACFDDAVSFYKAKDRILAVETED